MVTQIPGRSQTPQPDHIVTVCGDCDRMASRRPVICGAPLGCTTAMRETGYIQLLKSFSEISDPRADLGKRHRLDDILFIALVGLLAGANDAEGMVRFA
ncbi:MAG: transposase family protein, partial [Myxococcales bacterium]|nr:transposase family protein [Myxococcales bacterium]